MIKKIVCHMCAFLCIACAVFGVALTYKTQSITANAETKALQVLWLEEYDIDEESNYVSFAIKTNSFNTSTIEDFQSEALEHVKINGVDLLEILSQDVNSKVKLSGAMIYVKTGLYDEAEEPFEYAIKENSEDRIVIEKGFYLPTLEETENTFEFYYDEVASKFIAVGNPDLAGENAYGETLLHDVYSDNYNYRQLFIHFVYPIIPTKQYIFNVQYDAETLAKDMRRRGLSSPTDMWCADFSNLGMRNSILNNVIVDGKSLQEWMILDKDKVHDSQNLVMLSFHGSYDRGTLLTVEFSPASSCNPSSEGLHTLELREGMVFPTMVKLVGTHKYTRYHKADGSVDKQWVAVGQESPIEDYQEENVDKSKGCGSAILSSSSVLPITVLSIVGALSLLWRKNGENSVESGDKGEKL